MRQRLELFIAGLRAETDGDSLVLFNYTVEELKNPTIVKNSYSRQLTLKAGITANDLIFNSCFRLDRRIGDGFDPSKRVPFRIYADGGVIIEAGYVKLDGTSRENGGEVYKVTLYGGLGSFLYSLSASVEEGKRTLASLDFLGTGDPDSELTFNINRTTIIEAWTALRHGGAAKWGVINFCRAYNGYPDKFDATRAVIKPDSEGVPPYWHDPDSDPPDYYYCADRTNGLTIAELGRQLTEWQTRDIRSYLQRPVLSVKALFDAIRNPDNNGGYEVTLDSRFFNADNPYYAHAWMALPMLTSIVKDEITYKGKLSAIGSSRENARTLAYQQIGDSNAWLPELVEDATGYLPTVTDEVLVEIPVSFGLYLNTAQPDLAGKTVRLSKDAVNLTNLAVVRAVFVEAIGDDGNGNIIARAPIRAFFSHVKGTIVNHEPVDYDPTCEELAQRVGFTPFSPSTWPAPTYGDLSYGDLKVEAGGGLASWNGDHMSLSLSGRGVKRIYIYWSVCVDHGGHTGVPLSGVYYGSSSYQCDYILVRQMQKPQVTVLDDGGVRSDTVVDKAHLLGFDMTPADFLLSYCKRFGLMFRIDPDTKTIHIETHSTFYKDSSLDIGKRIDAGRGRNQVPIPFDTLIMQAREEGIGSAWPVEYEKRYGRPYGAKRINTGYEFNAGVRDLLDKSVLKTAAEVKRKDMTFCTVRDAGNTHQIPSAFLFGGMKYYLYRSTDQERVERPIPSVPQTAGITYFDGDFNGYDLNSRPEFDNADGKPCDGAGVLLFLQGFRPAPPGSAVTDDLSIMTTYGEGPCWILDPADLPGHNDTPSIPLFGRYVWDGKTVDYSMDFGTPAELDIPGVAVREGSDVFSIFWERYFADRYNKDTKTVTLYVYTAGLQMNVEAMRRFYWFRGSLWALNRIIDYDLAGDGVTKCEFVQVQDIDNYLNFNEF